MRSRFFLGITIVVALIWGPMWLWSHTGSFGPTGDLLLRICLIGGIALGGYLLWAIVIRSLLGRDED